MSWALWAESHAAVVPQPLQLAVGIGASTTPGCFQMHAAIEELKHSHLKYCPKSQVREGLSSKYDRTPSIETLPTIQILLGPLGPKSSNPKPHKPWIP